jgi:hypothetical protein
MPFVTQDHRVAPDQSIPGDLCFIYYKYLVDSWKATPRWTTAHNLFKKMVFDDFAKPMSQDHICAMQLAWQVFFNIYVMDYEQVKRKENGDI